MIYGLIKENYFFNESLLLTQNIENTILKSAEPIVIITDIHDIFEIKLKELKSWKTKSLTEYFIETHRFAKDENTNGLSKEQCDKEVTKRITEKQLNGISETHKLYRLFSFTKMVRAMKIHQNEDFESIKLLYHLHEFITNVEMVKSLLDEIIHDYEKFKIIRFDDYFKSFFAEHVNKIQVNLQLKELTYFYWFVEQNKLFSMHHDSLKNKKMLEEFFENNFMYTDAKGNPKHFKRFIKEISDVKYEDNKSQENFANELISKLEEFKSVKLFVLGR